jgi:hypothetical protein
LKYRQLNKKTPDFAVNRLVVAPTELWIDLQSNVNQHIAGFEKMQGMNKGTRFFAFLRSPTGLHMVNCKVKINKIFSF